MPDTINLIVECKNEDELPDIFTIRYRLPLINCCVVETDKSRLDELKSLKSVISVHFDTHITMQMNRARKIINADNSAYTGKGVTVAVLDTGIADNIDITPRLLYFKDFVNGSEKNYDDNGHGTHVCGICGGDGSLSGKLYRGIAPQCNFIMLKTLNADGRGNTADVLAGIQWIANNKD
jgi:serine protease AprX